VTGFRCGQASRRLAIVTVSAAAAGEGVAAPSVACVEQMHVASSARQALADEGETQAPYSVGKGRAAHVTKASSSDHPVVEETEAARAAYKRVAAHAWQAS